VLKLANNNEVSFLQEKVEYLRTEINNLELKKTECTNHVLTLNRRVDDLIEIVNMYQPREKGRDSILESGTKEVR
jgi:hypothetical protein